MSTRDSRGRFPKGVSGNPAGRPVDSGIKDKILAELALPDGSTGRTRLEAFARKLVDLCIDGDVSAMRLLLDRGWPARLELQHDGIQRINLVDLSDAQHEGRSTPADSGPPVLDLRSIREPAPSAPAPPIPPPAAPVMSTPAPQPATPGPVFIDRYWERDGGGFSQPDLD